jgi:hypothetical protein
MCNMVRFVTVNRVQRAVCVVPHDAAWQVEWSWHVLLGEPWWEPERDPWVLCPKDYHACHQK